MGKLGLLEALNGCSSTKSSPSSYAGMMDQDTETCASKEKRESAPTDLNKIKHVTSSAHVSLTKPGLLLKHEINQVDISQKDRNKAPNLANSN